MCETMDQRGLIPWKPVSCRSCEPSPKQRRVDILLQPFFDEQKRQENARRIYDIKTSEAINQMQARRRMLIYQTFKKRLQKKRIREIYHISTHATIMNSWHSLKKQDFASEVEVSEKQNIEVQEDVCDFQEEVKLFESKGYELGAETLNEMAVDLTGKEKANKIKDFNKSGKDTKGSKKPKSEGLSDPLTLAQEASSYLAQLKERVFQAEKEKSEMEQKQKQEMLEAKQREKEAEEWLKKKEQDEAILRTVEENTLKDAQLKAAEAEEQERISHRLELEQQIREKRNREWEAVLARDHELLLMMQHDRNNEVNYEHCLWQEERLKKLERKHIKHQQLCMEVFAQIVSLAEGAAVYKASTNCSLPNTEWWEWKNLFVKGAIQPFVFKIPAETTDDFIKDDNEVADQAATMDYLQEQGEWQGFEIVGTNKELGIILVELFRRIENCLKPVPLTYLSNMKLKLAVVGTPFSGKSHLSKLLEDQYGIIRIEVDKLVSSAVVALEEECTENEVEVVKEPRNLQKAKAENDLLEIQATEDELVPGNQREPVSAKILLSKQARDSLSKGSQVPDDVTVQLLLLEVEDLTAYDASAQSTLSIGKKKEATSKQQSPRVKQKEDLQSSQKILKSDKRVLKDKLTEEVGQVARRGDIGFILDGYPNTQAQAELLHRGLNGCDIYLDTSKQAPYKSIIVPLPEMEHSQQKPVYPLDAVFLLDAPGEREALKQAMAKHLDPKTGISYHLEYNPPPTNDRTGIASRLKPVEDAAAAGQRITEGMVIWRSLVDWISKFSNVHPIQRSEDGKIKHDRCCSIIQELLDARFKAMAAAEAAKAATEAEEAAHAAYLLAESASFHAKEVAQKVLFSKLAEVEANALLERSGNDSAAKEILKKKASEMACHKLQDAAKALKEAEAFAETARKASEDACLARQTAEEATSEVSVINQAKDTALAAAETARQAAFRAVSASQKAQAAAEGASSTFADVNASVESSDKGVLKEKLSIISSQLLQVTADTQPVATENTEKPLQDDLEFTEHLCQQWKELESTYLNRLRECFHKIRLERKETHRKLKEIKENFILLLKQPDEKQSLFDEFQGKYNRVDSSQRSTMKMKKQLQKKAEDLYLKLQSVCEGGLKLERYFQTCFLLHEYYFKTPSTPLKDKLGNLTNLSGSNISKQPKLSASPGWLSTFVDSLPQLHQVLHNAITSADIIYKSSSEPQSLTANSISSKTSKYPRKTVEDNDKKELLPTDRSDILVKAIQDEYKILLRRFQLIASKACGHVIDLNMLMEGAKKQMDDWMNKMHEAKIELVEEVNNIIQEAIEESIPLWYYMCLSGDRFYIDESQLQLDPPHPVGGLQPLPDLEKCHYQVLDQLVKNFQLDYPKGYVTSVKASEAVVHVVEYVHSNCKNDVSLSMIPRVPSTKQRPAGPFEVWKDYTKEILKVASNNESENQTQILDWRAFLVSLLDIHYNNFISSATTEDIVQAHNAFKEASNGSDIFTDITQLLDTRIWFDSDNNLDFSTNIKKIFHSMVSDASGMQWKSLLLYLCKSPELELALKKAHAALFGIWSEKFHLKPKELLQAFYPSGTEGACEQGCQMWSLQDFKELMERIQVEQRRKEISEDNGKESSGSTQASNTDTCPRSTEANKGSGISAGCSDHSVLSLQHFVLPCSVEREDRDQYSIEGEAREACNSIGPGGPCTNPLPEMSNLPGNAALEDKETTNEIRFLDGFEGSDLSERAVATMYDFLAACDEAFVSNQGEDMRQGVNEGNQGQDMASEGEVQATEDMVFKLEDLLDTTLAPDLMASLTARFDPRSVLVVPALSTA